MSEFSFEFKWLGRISYQEAEEVQLRFVKEAIDESKISVLVCEHEKTISCGIRGDLKRDLVASEDFLKSAGFKTVYSQRGGETTLHNPGQLVIYPIVPLSRFELGVREYVKLLTETALQFLNAYGLNAEASGKEPGLFTKAGKIAFFGIRVKKGVAFHGLAINVYNNIEDFDHIISCGQPEQDYDKLSLYGLEIPIEKLAQNWSVLFKKQLTESIKSLTLSDLQE